MRYADRIVFIKTGAEFYDPDIGEYISGANEEFVLPCHIVDLGVEKSMQIFGDYALERKICYLQNPLTVTNVVCVYKDKKYKVLADKQNSKVLYLEGDNSIG
ncbi:hypothetical protein [Streptococcus iners]|uniref:Uncharacterized protein n=1 Tax=Streptococcus iners TaxID=3028084 RepID=A0AA96VNX0_9STRE|nr:hypothetical protein [Streptococcus sp. 29887]MCK4024893.1 hypothetical protein [Streptococcus suis]WNY51534.1 hypothetical protein PW252_02405 [Streptococcus sp. 29887]